MLAFSKSGQKYAYIHIPKCCGKYIRGVIKNNLNVIKDWWDRDGLGHDMAHIPYDLAVKNPDNLNTYNFISFVRNPYHRAISIFKYITQDSSPRDFRGFWQYRLNLRHPQQLSLDLGRTTVLGQRDANLAPLAKRLKAVTPKDLIKIRDIFLTSDIKKMLKEHFIHLFPQVRWLMDETNTIPPLLKFHKVEEYKDEDSFFNFPNLAPPCYDIGKYYDSQTLKIINTLYHDDFELLDYGKIE